jgi:outer membrane protein assembly factor BamB
MKTPALFALAFVTVPAALLAADWPQWRGPDRTNVSKETGLLKGWPEKGPSLAWTYDNAGAGYSGPAVVGDRLYTMGGRGETEYLFALDLTSSPPKEAWAVKLGPLFQWKGNKWNLGPSATPTVDDGLVYGLGGQGILVCVEAASGKERWRKSMAKDLAGEVNPIGGGLEEPTPLGWGYTWSPLVDGDNLICTPGGKQGNTAALNKKTGDVVWRSKSFTDQCSYASPVKAEVGGVPHYVVVTNQGVAGVAAKDGSLLWYVKREEPFDDIIGSTPVVNADHVFTTVGTSGGDCQLLKLTGEGGKVKAEQVYENRDLGVYIGGVVLVGGHLYGASDRGGWTCMDFKTGKVAWAARRKLEKGSVTAAEGKLYCLTEKEGLAVLVEATPEGYKESGRFQLPRQSKLRLSGGGIWTPPVLANGKLYLRDQELLFCYDVKGK